MRITNFNNINPATWTAWKKAYIDDLNIKITSLWNHLVYQNPPYVVLNSITSDNPVNLETEGYRITVINSISNQPVDIFFPTHLQLHQGFYNDSNYGDALLGYWNEDTIYPMSFGTFTSFQFANGTTAVEACDFPSGYCCIANVLPSGSNTPNNEAKRNLKNYLIYPIGNGSFFTLNSYQTNTVAKYRRNGIGDLVNQIIINLCSSLRYYYHLTDEHKKLDAQGSHSVLNYSPQGKEYYVADIKNNLWTGSEDIVTEIYNDNNELIICDLHHQITEEVESQTLVYRLLINTNITSNNTNARVEVY